ncbi:glycosyltransferase family 4 protein [Metabacillus fastidiosus]|uniref:glycosyltransferase family 4 protein n=1 Tax=Metabacillus fastidiosus TaxID=1458 RepID=UPI003D2A688C
MNILHIPYGPAMIDLCLALRLKGINADSCHFYSNRYQFRPDYCLNLQNISVNLREEKIKNYLEEAIKKYDIFHFHFGETFLPDKSDLEILKNAGKKMVAHHHGSEVRMLSLAKNLNKYVRVKPEWSEEKIHNNLLKLSSYIDHAFVQDHELEHYVKGYYKNVHVIPHSIDIKKFKPNFPKEKNSPLIVHAPTLRDLKGTEYIIDAVNKLKKAGTPLNFQLIEGKTYSQTKELLSQADIVIDQLRIGAYGYVSTESMALGKPVICYIREDLVKKYPSELPIINANPDNIAPILQNLINQPENWSKLGMLGRRYVKQYHSTHKIAEHYIKVYNNL